MSLISPLNSNFSHSVNQFATQFHLTCSRPNFGPMQDRLGVCSGVDDSALLSIRQLVETAALPSFQLLAGGNGSMTLEEFVNELPKQCNDASLYHLSKIIFSA